MNDKPVRRANLNGVKHSVYQSGNVFAFVNNESSNRSTFEYRAGEWWLAEDFEATDFLSLPASHLVAALDWLRLYVRFDQEGRVCQLRSYDEILANASRWISMLSPELRASVPKHDLLDILGAQPEKDNP